MKLRRKFAVFAIVTICFLLHSTLFQALSFASISPNLLIVAGFLLRVYAGQERGDVDWVFLRASAGYFLWQRNWVLCPDLLIYRLCQRIFPQNVFPGRH